MKNLAQAARRAIRAILIGLAALAVLITGWILLSESSPEAAPQKVIDTDFGSKRTIERFDADGQPHGLHETYVDGRLTEETRFEHGQTLEQIFYHPDGSIREHWKEDENYEMRRID